MVAPVGHPATVVCTRCCDDAPPLASATVEHCHRCGEKVWLSAATTVSIAEHPDHDFEFCCIECMPEEIRTSTRRHPLTIVKALTPGQLRELNELREAGQ